MFPKLHPKKIIFEKMLFQIQESVPIFYTNTKSNKLLLENSLGI